MKQQLKLPIFRPVFKRIKIKYFFNFYTLIVVPQLGEIFGGGKVIDICLAFSTT